MISSQEQLSYSYTLPATPYMMPRTPRVLSSLVTRRYILRHSYRAGLGGREARSVCRDRELVENGLDRRGSFSAPLVKSAVFVVAFRTPSPENKSLIYCNKAHSFVFRDPEDPGSPKAGSAREDQIAKSRQVRSPEACARGDIDTLPPRLRGTTFSALSTLCSRKRPYFAVCLLFRALTPPRCRHIKFPKPNHPFPEE